MTVAPSTSNLVYFEAKTDLVVTAPGGLDAVEGLQQALSSNNLPVNSLAFLKATQNRALLGYSWR